MKKKNKKILILATSVSITATAFTGLAFNSEEIVNANTMKNVNDWASTKVPGDVLRIDGKEYYYINKTAQGVKVIAKEKIINKAFDEDNTNIFNPNDSNNIGYYLNNTYYNSLPNSVKGMIVNSSWDITSVDYAGNAGTFQSVDAKIGLLSYNEFQKSLAYHTPTSKLPYEANDDYFEYTITPDSGISSYVWTQYYGAVRYSLAAKNNSQYFGFRPAFVINPNTLIDNSGNVALNQVPTNKGTIPAQTITNKGATKTVNLANYFQDLDGDTLTYTVSSNASSRVTGLISGSTLTLTGQSKGSANITVTAKDPSGASVSQTFTTTVGNAAPTNKATIPAQEMSNIGQQITLNLGNYFQDIDGDSLSYTVSSSATNKVTTSVSGSTLTLTSVGSGESTITVTAVDGAGGVVSQTFKTTVKVPAPVNKNTIEAQVINGAGQLKQLNLSDYFDDASETLTYTVNSSETNKVSTTVNGDKLTLIGMTKGDSSITVTAKNKAGETTTQTFTTTVKNTSPTLTTNFNKLNLRPGEVSSVIVLNGIDLDGDNLSYVVTSSNDEIAKVTVSGNQLIVEGLIEGSANIMVKVIDGDVDYGHTQSTKTFTVDVAQPAPIAPQEPIDVDNTGGLTNGTVNLGDIFDDENPADLIFKPNVVVNEPEADIFIQNQMLMIENPKNDGLISVEVEATNIFGKTAVATLNMLIEVDNSNKTETKDGKASLKLLQGEFTLKTSDSESFGTVKLTAAKQTVTTGFAQDFGVVDARGTQEGWNVTISATPFTVETFDGFIGTPHQLPVGSLALNNVTGIERINHANKVDGLPTALINGLSVIDTNNSLSILNANQGEGLGEFKFNFGEDALALTVDARTAKIDTVNYPDKNTPYASTVTWDLIYGPQM